MSSIAALRSLSSIFEHNPIVRSAPGIPRYDEDSSQMLIRTRGSRSASEREVVNDRGMSQSIIRYSSALGCLIDHWKHLHEINRSEKFSDWLSAA